MKKYLAAFITVATLGAASVQAQVQETATVEFNYATLKKQIFNTEFPIVVDGEKKCHLKENSTCTINIPANQPVKIEFGEKSFFNPYQYNLTMTPVTFDTNSYRFVIVDGSVSFLEGITAFTAGGAIPALIGVGLDKLTEEKKVTSTVPDVLVKNAVFQVLKVQ